MSDHHENVVGHIPVIAQLAIGIEQLALFVTETRIIVAHMGKRGAGALATSALFGRLSGGFEDLLKSGAESTAKRALPSLTPEKILSANKDNFHMRFEEIVSVRLAESHLNTEITVLTQSDKFDFRTSLPVDGILGLLETSLGSKLSVQRLPAGARSSPRR